jgi:hypothetical protein
VLRYRLFDVEGNDHGGATCSAMVRGGDAIRSTDGRLFRVVDLIPTFADEGKYVGF